MKSFWIKERHNPQLGTYYVGCGQLSKQVAKKMGNPIYGHNVMLEFKTESDYVAKILDLRTQGARVHD